MRTPVLLLLLGHICWSAAAIRQYSNHWAVQIRGGPAVADALAAKHGFVNLGSTLSNYYLFAASRLRKRSIRPARHMHKRLVVEPNITWFEQQVVHRRVKRDFIYDQYANGYTTVTDCNETSCPTERWPSNASSPACNDPEWPKMWYLNRGNGLDHNVRDAWELGYTGKDVVVTILDDGLEWTHPDIEANYDPKASYDFNSRDDDPTPRYESTNENKHGTRCAGEVAAVSNNTLCIVGIAYNAKIGAIRMLDGVVNDWIEAASLGHNRQHIDIYSASWGPDDDGRTVDGPGKMASLAFEEGVSRGRRGKGSIFIWASGNGGRDSDSCNCDGYTNSIYTLSISSATESGRVPWYSEACSSTLATTYSSGSNEDKMIVTTDLRKRCTASHSGTSASAPLAAGICALALQANPNVTWRDLQHIVVRTARPDGLVVNDWAYNGVRRKVSHSFGYGLMDAGAMVRLARKWTTVPAQHTCVERYALKPNGRLVPNCSMIKFPLSTDGCAADPARRVVYLEHVQARITLTSNRRGHLIVYLTSPSGTRSTLLPKRTHDNTRQGFHDWAFMTTHCWGELAKGRWMLEVQNDDDANATLLQWDLVMYGTAVPVGPYGGAEPVKGKRFLSRSASSASLRSVLVKLCLCLALALTVTAEWLPNILA